MFDFEVEKGLRGKKIKARFKQEIEPQEVLLDAMSQGEDLISQRRFEVPLQRRVLIRFCFLFLLLILLFWFKSFQLQVFEGQKLFELSQRNFQRVYFKRANRGVIYDKDFNQLVFNDLSFDFVCEKADLPLDSQERENILKAVSEALKRDFDEFSKEINQATSSQVIVAENLDRETLILIEAKIKNWPGFYLEENIKRFYVDGSIFFPVVGYLGRITEKEIEMQNDYSITDYIGKSGLEKSYEDILKGEKGRLLVVKDVRGREASRQVISEPEDGKSLVLWLDFQLQKKVIEVLQKSIGVSGAQAGAAIVMDAKTGGILSLVSLPSFDNNIFFQKLEPSQWEEILKDKNNPFWNRCISATYPTGSTIKPLMAVAALEEKTISPDKSIFCEGKIEVANPWFPEEPWVFRDWTSHGWTDMRKAIAQSCNVYFYTVGGGFGSIKGLGEEKIKKYLELFGWGQTTGIDLPGERPGLIPDKQWKREHFEDEANQIWLPGDTYNLSIGQGYLSITPLQVVASFSALANGGKLLRPQIVKAIVDEQKNVIKEFAPDIIRQDFVDAYSIKVAREGMREAVTYGSSYILNDLPVKVASKTGTAQTSKKDYYHNWVTVFAPYDDPEIVITIMIENVPEEQVAVLPVAKEILNWYFTR